MSSDDKKFIEKLHLYLSHVQSFQSTSEIIINSQLKIASGSIVGMIPQPWHQADSIELRVCVYELRSLFAFPFTCTQFAKITNFVHPRRLNTRLYIEICVLQHTNLTFNYFELIFVLTPDAADFHASSQLNASTIVSANICFPALAQHTCGATSIRIGNPVLKNGTLIGLYCKLQKDKKPAMNGSLYDRFISVRFIYISMFERR